MTLRFLLAAILSLTLMVSSGTGFAAADSKAPVDAPVATEIQQTIDPVTGLPQDVAPVEGEGHEAGHEKDSGGLPQLNVATYPSQIFWLLVMFSVLYLTFSKSILPAIGGVVAARDSHIKSNLDAAQALKDKAESIQISYEKNLELAKANASKVVMEVELAAKKKASEQVETFRKKAEGDVQAAEARVNAAKDKAMQDMTSVAADVASAAAEKITGVGTDRQKAQSIVQTIADKAKAA